ncbi:MAG: hypothetical protein QG656_687, partial [Candidatus Hydrogenedentes bacterium]|nr:hypothetical protein [Candidatus Hydrogenedentota bacterium]
MKTISGNVLCVAILGVLIASPWALAQPACDAPPVPSGEYPVNGTADLPVDVALSWVDTAAKMGPIPPPMTGAKAGERVYPAGAGIIPDGTPSPLKAGGLALPFLDNMEGGANGWQASGYWHQITNPQLLSVSGEINPRLVFLPDSAGALPAAFSGTTCWWYGEDSTGTFLGNDFWRGQEDGSGGTSVGPNGGMLTSPKIDLTAALNATLSFKTWWEIEGVDVDRFDMMYVEVSTDGGQVYLPLGAGSINPANDVDGEAWRPFSSKGLGETGEWINVTFDLTPHVGHEAIVRFRFETIDELYNGFRGWFIDDVSVQGVVTPPPVLISVDPGSGYKDTLVYLTGNNFVNGATVHIGTVKAETIVVSSSTCHVTVPDMPAGLYDVTLTNPDGQSSTLPDAFQVTIVVPPSVTQIVPYWGYENAVTAVEITGTDFKYGATASVGGTALMGVVVVSATKITGSVPAGLPVGFQNVRVTNPDEQFGSLIGGFQVVAACPTTYDVYLSGQLICENTPYRTCKPAFLLEGREYEWQVVAKNRSAQTPGPVWSFSTEGLCGVPATPIGPSPAPQATGVPVNTALTWTLPPSVPKNGVPGDDPYVEPPVSPWKAVSVNGEMFTTTDNQNNAGTGKVDYDMDKYLYRSNSITPIECDVQYSGTGTPTSVQLLIYAWDVDETGEVVNNILCLEVDNVYFNGTLVGKMTGANDEWSTTALDVAPALLQTGKNRVKVTVDEEQRTIKRWAINVDWVQLIVNDEPSGEASIRYAVTDATDYMPGDTVKGTVEVDTTASTQQVKVETNLLDPSGVNVAGTSTTYTVALNADDPMSVNLLLPPAWQEGAYTFQVFVYDAVSGIVQDSATTQFHVGACVPSYDVYLNGNLVCAGVYTLSCNPGVLQPRTDYTWQVIARNASFTVYSESWTFRTEGDDLTPPVIQINGSKDVTVERGVPYVDLGAAATDDVDGIVTANIVTSGLPIDTCYAGVYYVTYNVSDAAGNAAVTVVRTVHVVDTTPPVISMLGSSPVDVSYGAAYHDAGATALDACGDNLTGAIVTQSTVDVLLLGTYQVRYNVSDVFGNAAAQVVRTVRVVDTVAPVITLSGAPVVEVVVNAVYVDAGATAFDICDGDLTAQIAVNGLPVSTAIAGEHTITYDVKDSSGNAAPQVTRTVRVVPGSAPVISLTGNTQITVECCATYRDEGATALDAEDGDLTNAVAVGGLPIDTCEPGQYTITYDVEDSSGNKAPRMTRTVDVVDNQPPVITLLGASSITVVRNKPFTDPGAEAQDKCEGDLTAAIVKGGATVNTAVLGTYVLTYNVADASGNTAAEVTRTVNVVAGSAPVVVLTGMNPVVIGCCDNYTDAGATAVDLEDGNLTANIVTAGLPIDTCVPGTYFVDYNVTDSSLNPAMQVTRTVVVEDTMPPVITIVGDASITLERGDTYVEAGATALDACQGDLTGSIVTVSWVNTCVVGQYAVMYNVADAAGNEAVEVVRNVTVEDTVGPVISLNGDGLVEVECCTAYVDAWATALDVCGEDLTGNIAVTGLPINSFIPGDYTVRYNVSDYTGNAAVEAVRTVRVVDTTVPVITINGLPSVDVLV